MVSLTTASKCFFASPYSLPDLNTHFSPSCAFVFNRRGRRRTGKQEHVVSLNVVVAAKEREKGGSFLGFPEVNKRNYRDSCIMCGGFLRRCKKGLGSEGDFALEDEIFEFMRNSENPKAFPSKKQLMDAGRLDLVRAIVRQGGWLAFGWDLDDDVGTGREEKELQGLQENGVKGWNLTMVKEYKNGNLHERVESHEDSSVIEGNEVRRFEVSSFAVNSSGSTSSSGRSLQEATEDDSGIEGILSRLRKQRNTNFGFGLREKDNSSGVVPRDGGKDDCLDETSKEETVAGLGRSKKLALLNPDGGRINDSEAKPLSKLDGFKNSLKLETWRTWSIQRARFLDKELEAAKNASNEGAMDVSGDEILEVREVGKGHLNRQEELNSYHLENNYNEIQSHIKHLELELSSIIHTLRSNTGELLSQKGYEGLGDDLRKFSDALEFQENEIMNAQDRLLSIRAKLAVSEGKMVLAIIDARKTVEEKQKRIRASQLIHTACIVWPYSDSKVLLVGSFDGWASQRKMEKLNTGIFSLCLKLYPGRHQIKFIVDGEWKIDPLRPIVHNNGYENNLLIIT